MKITRRQLRGIIQEHMGRLLAETGDDPFTFKIDKYPPDIESLSLEQPSQPAQDVIDVIQKFKGPMGQRQWMRVRNEFYNMTEGGDEYGIRQLYYPGWTNEDFISVIVAVEGSYSP